MNVTQRYPVPTNELERVAALHALDIIGSQRDAAFDAVVALACESFQVPIAWVSLLDEHRPWFKAHQGADLCTTDRDSAFCNYPVTDGHVFVVNDAFSDERFKLNRLVINDPHVRFYAGHPLFIDPGICLGALCILDTKPRAFSGEEALRLGRLAEIVTALLKSHRDARFVGQLGRDLREQNLVNREQAGSLERYKTIFDPRIAAEQDGSLGFQRDERRVHVDGRAL